MKIFIVSMFLSSTAFASGDFSFSVTRDTGREWIRVLPRGDRWDCASNTVSLTETPGLPLKGLNWRALEREAKSMPKTCDQVVKISDDLKGLDRVVTTCLSQPATKALYETLVGNCKADI